MCTRMHTHMHMHTHTHLHMHMHMLNARAHAQCACTYACQVYPELLEASALLHFTGSGKFNRSLSRLANQASVYARPQ